jgi:GT2 family glycosyltransferase
MEDVDLALRLRAAGWLGAGAPDAVAVHLGSATFGNRSRWQVETAAASRGYMLRKYGVLRSGVGTALWALAIELAGALLDAVRTRSLGALTSYRRGWRAADGERAHAPADAINEEIGLVGAIRRRLPALRSG